jgi:hypothetical protein
MPWYSISPRLDDDGRFVALAGKATKNDPMKPVKTGAVQLGQVRLIEEVHDANLAGNLGIAGRVEMSTDNRTRVLVREVSTWDEHMPPLQTPGTVIGTRWGVGFRIVVAVTGFEADVSLDLNRIKAAVQIGAATASYSIEGIGIAEPSFFSHVPGPGQFDQETMDAIEGTADALANWIATHEKDAVSRAVPFHVATRHPLEFTESVDARAVYFAVTRIHKRRPFHMARDGAVFRDIDVGVLKNVYREFCGAQILVHGIPSPAQKRAAEEWLAEAGLL